MRCPWRAPFVGQLALYSGIAAHERIVVLLSVILELHVLNASSEDDFDAVFENLIRLRAGGLVISADALLPSRH